MAGLVIMGGVVVMETFTDCMNSDKTKRKGIYIHILFFIFICFFVNF